MKLENSNANPKISNLLFLHSSSVLLGEVCVISALFLFCTAVLSFMNANVIKILHPVFFCLFELHLKPPPRPIPPWAPKQVLGFPLAVSWGSAPRCLVRVCPWNTKTVCEGTRRVEVHDGSDKLRLSGCVWRRLCFVRCLRTNRRPRGDVLIAFKCCRVFCSFQYVIDGFFFHQPHSKSRASTR